MPVFGYVYVSSLLSRWVYKKIRSAKVVKLAAFQDDHQNYIEQSEKRAYLELIVSKTFKW